MSRIIAKLSVIMFLMGLFTAYPVNAEVSRQPGVNPGDWAKYAIAFNFSTNDPNPIMITPPLEDVEYYTMVVQSVVSTKVEYETIIHYKNGTEITIGGWQDVESGETTYGSTWFGPIIAANLTAGDKVYLNQYSPTLNSTETRIYAGSQRQVNCLFVKQNWTSPSQQQYVEYSIFWDKVSGVFVTMNETMILKDLNKGYTTSLMIGLTITETNIWKPVPTVFARIFILPNVLNIRCNGKWILVLIQLPKKCNAKDIEKSSITLNNTIHPIDRPIVFARHWILVKFERSEVISYILDHVHLRRFVSVTLTITGEFKDGSLFGGSDRIKMLMRLPKGFI
jgi:hypothetical protein